MDLSSFEFPFDPNLVALRPAEPRDAARLLVVDRSTGAMRHRHVRDLPDLLGAGDLLVANDTKVLPARVTAVRVKNGAALDVLFVRPVDAYAWEVLVKGRFQVGEQVQLAPDALATIAERGAGGTVLRIESARPLRAILEESGLMPLPPYIKRPPSVEDRTWYQTSFAREEGAIAAPTAGLHFTDSLRAALRAREMGWATVTLHVGPGTFKPVAAAQIEDHRMDPEQFSIQPETAQAIAGCRSRGGRVVAIGTTVVRTLESSVADNGTVREGSGKTALFVTPGYRFGVVDVLLTNFHLPKSTLLMLVSAFAGLDLMREAYRVAVQERYRFYSYGDAMLIL